MITTHQIRSVLRVYGDQLKRRGSFIQDSVRPNQKSNDLVSISIDARRKQMVNAMSNHLISQITPHDHGNETEGEISANDPLVNPESLG